jgi:hypothetical protein
MSIESLISRGGQQATITAEAPDGQVPAQDALGGADRSDANWILVASGVPCLLNTTSSTLSAFGGARNDARANVISARIYFAGDPVPSGISTRHRITITDMGAGGPRSLGLYAVQGANQPVLGSQTIIQVDCERLRTP